jgi:hypothetical protein
MPIKDISIVPNKHLPVKMNPIKEKMDVYLPNVIEGISRRNGMIYILVGSGGSGKTSLLLNMFKSNKLYRGKFHTIFYICPQSSFSSVEKHPFSSHDKVYHELTTELLESIYTQLQQLKETAEQENEVEYSCVIFDDMADSLKDNNIQIQLNKMLIKARHLCCSFIFTLQGYYYFPRMLRKQITYVTIFKPNNEQEWTDICKELMHLNKDDSILLYDYVFDAPYNHLDIDTRDDKLYKNFNLLLLKK